MTTQAHESVAVITGASSGIGKAAAKALVTQGWKVIGLGRNQQRCEQAEAEIRELAQDTNQITVLRCDLALMGEAMKAAEAIAGLTDRVDVLLNNAGGLTKELTITTEGNENTFASNHLGHFLLTRLLLPLLRASSQSADRTSPKARIINVSSNAHEHCEGLDWDDLQSKKHFVSATAYCRAKLANILFTHELAQQLEVDNISVHAMHPGIVHSNFASHGDNAMQQYFESKAGQTSSPEEAAETLVWLATSDEAGKTTNEYFYQKERAKTNPIGRDNESARRLWQESEKLVTYYL